MKYSVGFITYRVVSYVKKIAQRLEREKWKYITAKFFKYI